MLVHWKRDRQGADRAEFPLRPLVPLTVQLLVLQRFRTLLARLLMLLAVDLLAVDATVLDEAAGRAVPDLDGVVTALGTSLRSMPFD